MELAGRVLVPIVIINHHASSTCAMHTRLHDYDVMIHYTSPYKKDIHKRKPKHTNVNTKRCMTKRLMRTLEHRSIIITVQ